MFGDLGHGSMILGLGIYILFNYYSSDKRSIGYMIFLMGIFSVYCGLIYNEFFARPFILFNSCYSVYDFTKENEDCVYPVGTDWIWSLSSDESIFINSFKMKFSIIIGVLHMLGGLVIKGVNAIYFKKKYDLIFDAIPQFIFLSLSFGYMVVCIIGKWL
jgi:V-type H+-transporting ATPase subunit a